MGHQILESIYILFSVSESIHIIITWVRTGLLMVKLQEGYHLYEELLEDNRCELYEDEKDVLLACLFWSFPVMFWLINNNAWSNKQVNILA